ncbi:MAG: hypothetical protein ACK4VV_00730 [Pseudomonas sp.]
MADDDTPILDFQTLRRECLHVVHDSRLEKMRDAFEQAFPLPGKRAASKTPRSGKKKKKPRKS